MKKLTALLLITGVLLLSAPAEAGRYRHRRGGNFLGGFVAGAVAGALTGALLRPPVVVAPAPVVGPAPVYARRLWVPGAYVVRYRSCGTPYRAWRRGYYRAYY